MGNRPILLPYMGAIDIITQYPGQWDVEYYILRSKHAEFLAAHDAEQINTAIRRGSPLEGDATLTFKIAAGAEGVASRRFNRIPPSAHSYVASFENDTGAAPF